MSKLTKQTTNLIIKRDGRAGK